MEYWGKRLFLEYWGKRLFLGVLGGAPVFGVLGEAPVFEIFEMAGGKANIIKWTKATKTKCSRPGKR